MPITRTPMVDDDGSGTTGTIINNAWKQELYGQIDALAVGLPIVYAGWVPVDGGGGGLTLGGSGNYAKIGRVVWLWGNVTYPANSNGGAAVVGGLPFPNGTNASGFALHYGAPVMLHFQASATGILVLNATTMAQMSNAQVSGFQMVFSGMYLLP